MILLHIWQQVEYHFPIFGGLKSKDSSKFQVESLGFVGHPEEFNWYLLSVEVLLFNLEFPKSVLVRSIEGNPYHKKGSMWKIDKSN